MNLREFCQLSRFPTAVITTYNIDPLFFERVVLNDLVAGGATRISVLADAEQSLAAVEAARGQLVTLGRRYRLIPVHMRGAFHPKVSIRLGPNGALVACGSTNLTRAGWLGCRKGQNGGGNREATMVWRVGPSTPAAPALKRFTDGLVRAVDSVADRDELRQLFADSWLDQTPAGADEEAWTWVLAGHDATLASTLEARWRGRRFDRLRVVAGSTDRAAAMVRWAAKTFGVTEAVLEMDLAACSLDPDQLRNLSVRLRIVPYDGRPRTHMKVAVFDGPDGCAAVLGSANCSAAAWLRPARDGGNIEAVVVVDRCAASDFAGLFRDTGVEPLDWDKAGLVAPSAEPEDTVKPAIEFRLRRLELHRLAGEIVAFIEPGPPPGARVDVIVQTSRVPLSPAGPPFIYRGPQPDLDYSAETPFGFIEWQVDGRKEISNAVWIDDVDRLNQQAATYHHYGVIGRLASGWKTDDHHRLLEDLHALSQALLGDPREFPDGVRAPAQRKTAAAGSPPAPVTPADIIRALDDGTAANAQSVGAGYASMASLTGIMRLLFAESGTGGPEVPNDDPTAAEHQLSAEERDADHAAGDDVAASDTSDVNGLQDDPPTPPPDAYRVKLLVQLERFVDRLSDAAFAASCTARQLQQAAAYPLAAARFAERGAWLDADGRRQAGDLVRRTCEILLFGRQTTDPKAKAVQQRPPLLDEVRKRYAEEGRTDAFDTIIGDGTLWLSLTVGLAVLSGDTATAFGRNLVLRDVARNAVLLRSAAPEHLVPLAQRLKRDGIDIGVSRIKELAEWFDLLDEYLSQNFEAWKAKNAGAARVGDWLWNPTPGYAQIVELQLESGKARVHIRKKAETRPNVLLSFYINLRIVAEGDEMLRSLIAECTSA